MKYTYLILYFLLLFAGCKKEKTNPTTTDDNAQGLLVGRWEFTADTVKQTKNGSVTSLITNSILLNNPSTSYIEFKADGTGSESFGGSGGSAPFTYTLSDKILTENVPEIVSDGLTIPAHTDKSTIKILTAHSLEIFYDDSWTDDKGNAIRVTEAQYLSK